MSQQKFQSSLCVKLLRILLIDLLIDSLTLILWFILSVDYTCLLTILAFQEFLKQGEPTSARCDELESLKKRGCSVLKIENPQGSLKILKDKPVTNRKKGGEKLKPEDITQIQPQKLAVSLRSGVCFNSNPDFIM